MPIKKFSFVCAFLFVCNITFAQTEQDKHDSFIYLNWANDLLVQTDYYFSNGIDLGYIKVAQNHILLKKLDFVSFDHFSVVQDFFTPTNLDTETVLLEDRPYAAYLYGSYQKHLFAANQGLYLNPEIFVGIIGPGALGRHLQSFSHEISPSKPPQGWNNQVTNDLVLNLNFAIEKGLFKNESLLFNVFSKARFGTIYTDLSIGGRFRIGKSNDFFQSFKNLTFEKPEIWQLYFEIKPYVKIVGYNATLQGGIFSDTSPYTIAANDISRIVGVLDLSLTASYKNFYFNGIFNWNSKEFEQATSHQWVTLEFGWAF
jgi:hypothetical protein